MGNDKKMLFLSDELNWMKEDHFLTGDNIKSVRQICNNYISNKGDLPGLTLVFQELQDLENDFLIHILFEDHFLSKSIEQLL